MDFDQVTVNGVNSNVVFTDSPKRHKRKIDIPMECDYNLEMLDSLQLDS